MRHLYLGRALSRPALVADVWLALICGIAIGAALVCNL